MEKKKRDKLYKVLEEKFGNVEEIDEGVLFSIDEETMIEVLYKCPHCNLPDRYDSEEMLKRHQEVCILNPKNKGIASSKYLEVVRDVPKINATPKYNDPQLRVFLGQLTGIDSRTGEELVEEDYFKECVDWVEYDPNKEIVTHYTDAYKEHIETLEKYMKEDKSIKSLKDIQ